MMKNWNKPEIVELTISMTACSPKTSSKEDQVWCDEHDFGPHIQGECTAQNGWKPSGR